MENDLINPSIDEETPIELEPQNCGLMFFGTPDLDTLGETEMYEFIGNIINVICKKDDDDRKLALRDSKFVIVNERQKLVKFFIPSQVMYDKVYKNPKLMYYTKWTITTNEEDKWVLSQCNLTRRTTETSVFEVHTTKLGIECLNIEYPHYNDSDDALNRAQCIGFIPLETDYLIHRDLMISHVENLKDKIRVLQEAEREGKSG